jgi:hypothetical protein
LAPPNATAHIGGPKKVAFCGRWGPARAGHQTRKMSKTAHRTHHFRRRQWKGRAKMHRKRCSDPRKPPYRAWL